MEGVVRVLFSSPTAANDSDLAEAGAVFLAILEVLYFGKIFPWSTLVFHLHFLLCSANSRKKHGVAQIFTNGKASGTTWLKAIILTIMNPIGRTNDDSDDPLLKHSPNELKPSLEVQLFKENPNLDLSYMPSPRLFQTHVPYPMLPQSVKNSTCKIVYITR
ncbi:hypothetical protein PVK06_000521 [Gossypium arboreum]|uniref:Sulfotransferase n=1 Tax=Gossypium arboreum TaxID=29729 RepID=A0ABR0QZK7_GOSAR|nr:hypothetical protein PVK06_000521 [Gossypium arboreum]